MCLEYTKVCVVEKECSIAGGFAMHERRAVAALIGS